MAKTIIHVNQHRIRRNHKNGTRDPVITVKRGRSNRYGHEAVARDENGRELFRVVYRPERPLSCGARVWIETSFPVDAVAFEPPPLPAEDGAACECP